MHLECITHPRTLRFEEEKVFVIIDSFPAECNLSANLLLGQLALFASVAADLLKFMNLPAVNQPSAGLSGKRKVRINQKASPDLHMYLADFDDHYADCECCFRECTMNLTNPAKTDPIIATYRNQLVGLSLWAINNQILIPNIMAYIAA